MKIYYTSDWHLFHQHRTDPNRGIIQYSKRPFSNIEEMNQAIIDRTNERVGPGDTLKLLGDVTFARPEQVLPLLLQLRCKNIDLIAGNHDSHEIRRLRHPDGRPFWRSVRDLDEVTDEGRKVVLCHYAMRTWNRAHHGAYMLHGHSHGSLEGNSQSLDVGVDCWDFRPVTLDECIARMATLPPYRSGDHHV